MEYISSSTPAIDPAIPSRTKSLAAFELLQHKLYTFQWQHVVLHDEAAAGSWEPFMTSTTPKMRDVMIKNNALRESEGWTQIYEYLQNNNDKIVTSCDVIFSSVIFPDFG